MVINVIALLLIMSYALRSASIASVYGVIDAEIPVMLEPIKDPTFHKIVEKPNAKIDENTPIVILTEKAFFFGEMKSFGKKFPNVRNKFFVNHYKDAPNVSKLIQTMKKWQEKSKIKGNVLVFMPAQSIPIPIVIQIISSFKKYNQFERIVLASGIK